MNDKNKQMSTIVFIVRRVVPLAITIIPLVIFARTGNIKPAFVYIGIGFFVYAAYLLVGYLLKWTHIYCFYQTLNRQQLTPDEVSWSKLRPGDGYITPALNAVLGIGLLLFGLLA